MQTDKQPVTDSRTVASVRRTFYFNTGVQPHLHNPLVKLGKGEILSPNGVIVIPFVCKDVPASSTFKFACDNPDLPEAQYSIVRPIIEGALLSKYAYFSKP